MDKPSPLPTQNVDILIITALRSEYEQVLAVNAGAVGGSAWRVGRGPLDHEVAFQTFTTHDGSKHLEVAAAWATGMGTTSAAALAERLIAEYKPRCLAMCGVCAGRRGDVGVGDVIVADRVWSYESGKSTVEQDEQGRRSERMQHDTETYSLRSDWKKAAEAFVVPESLRVILEERPRPIEAQADWVLERIKNREKPPEHPDWAKMAPDYDTLLPLLWKKGLLKKLQLTKIGRERIEERMLRYPKGLPTALPPFKVHVGPIGTGSKVVKDDKIFDKLSNAVRKVIGLEMEAAAIGLVAHEHQDQMRFIVMKGVMDHADDWKSDAVKQFAARASAECLIAFLRTHMPPADQRGSIVDPASETDARDPVDRGQIAKRAFATSKETGLLPTVRAKIDNDSSDPGSLVLRDVCLVIPRTPRRRKSAITPEKLSNLADFYDRISRAMNDLKEDYRLFHQESLKTTDFILQIEAPAELASEPFENAANRRTTAALRRLFRCVVVIPSFDSRNRAELTVPIADPRMNDNSVAIWHQVDREAFAEHIHQKDCYFAGPATWMFRRDEHLPVAINGFDDLACAVLSAQEDKELALRTIFQSESRLAIDKLLDIVTKLREKGERIIVFWDDLRYGVELATQPF